MLAMSDLRDMMLLFGELGESDCEEIGAGILQQPINALSSGAYTLFGLWLIWRALHRRSDERPVEIFYGLALASVGIGSIAFHGPVPPGARLLHDLTIAAVLAVIAARNLGALMGRERRWVIGTSVMTIVLVGAVMGVAPDLGNALTGVVGVGALITEVLVYRGGHRRFSRRIARLLTAIVLLLAFAGIIYVLGRTGGPICDPDSYFQGHALWHVLTAGAFMLYGYAAFSPTPD
jgi:predicted membrane channel-forming protein YqfA (hemolysin III family)